MPREECSIKDHRWKARPRGLGEFCEICNTHFPCDERDCGHLDCIDIRRKTEHPPICFNCRHRVDLTVGDSSILDENHVSIFKCYNISVRGRTKIICEKCLDSKELTE
jgi:hypothetical protein